MRRAWKETAVVAVGLTLLAALVYAPNAIHGGFISDAWANRAIYVFAPQDGFAGALDRFFAEPNLAARPLYAVYLVALNSVLGAHMGFWLTWLVATCVLASLILYLLLRKLGFAFVDGALIAALILIFPATSSLALWAATVQIPVAIALAALGFLVALWAFEAEGARRAALHAVSLTCFVASLLFYEAALGLMLASVLLYRLRVPWGRAAARWAVDVVVLVSLAAFLASSSSGAKEVQDAAGMWRHAWQIFEGAWILLADVVLPFDSARWYVLGLIVLLPLSAAVLAGRLPAADPTRARLRRWLTVGGSGIVVVALGYAVYVPGIDYYQPLAPGIANRVNAVAAIGWVLTLYALVAMAATMAFRGISAARSLSTTFIVVACVLIGSSWAAALARDSDGYRLAFTEGQRVLATVESAVPDPAPGSVIWTFGQPVEAETGIPVFGNTWDMTTSVQLRYGESTIDSFVGYPGTTFDCRPEEIVPGGHPEYETTDPTALASLASQYGLTYFVDTSTGRFEEIRTPGQCRRASDSFERSPWLPD